MRAMSILRWFLLAFLVLASSGHAQSVAEAQALAAFAEKSGLQDISGFIETVQSLRATGHLPPRYVTKDEAATHGWHGGGLCTVWPGRVIGGDMFDNAAGTLPGSARTYHEADLDESCIRRGPKRLTYAADGAIYFTPDHYRHFIPVP
jgi:hypothetical protein